MIEPSRLTIGLSVSTAAAASMWRTRKISVTKPLGLPRRAPPTGAVDAAPAIGWTRRAPPATGTATKPLARKVDRNSSKYSLRDSGRSVTTETRPCTAGSMMKVRPVTRDASWMKARMSASRRFSTYCDQTGESGVRSSARAMTKRFTDSVLTRIGTRRGRRDPPSRLAWPPRRADHGARLLGEVTRWPFTETITSPGTKPAERNAAPPSLPPGLTMMPSTRPFVMRG